MLQAEPLPGIVVPLGKDGGIGLHTVPHSDMVETGMYLRQLERIAPSPHPTCPPHDHSMLGVVVGRLPDEMSRRTKRKLLEEH